MQTLFERSFLAGIGLLSMTHEKDQKIVDELIHDEVRSALDELGVAIKQDIQDMVARIDALDKQVRA